MNYERNSPKPKETGKSWCPICESGYNFDYLPARACSSHVRYWLCRKGGPDGFEFPLPRLYGKHSFANFDPYLPSLRQKLVHFSQWVQGERDRGLILCGGVGSGKTHMLASIYRELALQGKSIAFIRVMDFLAESYDAFNRNTTPNEIVERIVSHQFLFLDDLGAEKSTEFKRERIFDLIDRAYIDEKTLIITSNAKLQDLSELDARIPSRLVEMCDLVEFSEPDYRVRLAQGRYNRGVTASPNLELVQAFEEAMETET